MDHQTMGGTRIRPAWIVAAGLAVLALVAVGVPLVSLLYVGILLLCPLGQLVLNGAHRDTLHREAAVGRHEET